MGNNHIAFFKNIYHMQKKSHTLITLIVCAACLVSCRGQWTDPENWYISRKGFDADVFYLVSTNIVHEEDADGNTLYRALNTDEEKQLLELEMAHLEKKVFPDSLNFYAPYYHQHTLDAIGYADYWNLVSDISDEVYSAFKHYLHHFNEGRPVILVGFSQGALLAKELLKRMTDSEYSHIAAAYILGWGLNSEDMKSDHIRPAVSADDCGVCISFNSVADTSARWKAIMDGACCCINPVNWSTEPDSACFEYAGQNLTVQLDTARSLLVVKNFTEPELPFVPIWPKGCLHFYEIQFYNGYLNRNALHRLGNFRYYPKISFDELVPSN